ncbi:TetR/AcrR family transcriptional regulator [Modestobacter sp. VKM Ac-2986]|uniref:TetR/AcrR family transcriptional regulator n=1 Tax=Modestobacter sp. VKM Ac-2986 TaxID=3004140 RepID=UPI0022AB6F6D|nr:TetR/AcrR family transcriptional regulator [Modestobacter sp. VKM Ac-2986]MCZ2830665.1 TetR/AcrR family transcriptional regulator [Modestobacter sp. VKM Ac-2986]
MSDLEKSPQVLEKGPQGQRRGRGARERILDAAQQLFREQGIRDTGMDQLCAVAGVSKRTVYQHFGSKGDLVIAHLRRVDPDVMPEVFDRTDLTPRERLLAVFQAPLSTADATSAAQCGPLMSAFLEIGDPEHPARVLAREYTRALTVRLIETAREAGAADPELLGQQLALLLDGVTARTRTLGEDALPTAVGIAAALIDQATVHSA